MGGGSPDSESSGMINSASKESAKRKKLSAMEWLMEVAINSKELRFLPMFRIDAEEVRSELGLERRKSKLYSLEEISRSWGRVRNQVDVAMEKEPRDRSFKERKLVELDGRTRHLGRLLRHRRVRVSRPRPRSSWPVDR